RALGPITERLAPRLPLAGDRFGRDGAEAGGTAGNGLERAAGRKPRGEEGFVLVFRKQCRERGIGRRRRSGSDGWRAPSFRQPGAERRDTPRMDVFAIR